MLGAISVMVVKFGLGFEEVIQRLEKNASWGSVPQGQRV
jgi:hypothetical protein